jgi:uncharacterized protein YjbI with pentapeptide repeats
MPQVKNSPVSRPLSPSATTTPKIEKRGGLTKLDKRSSNLEFKKIENGLKEGGAIQALVEAYTPRDFKGKREALSPKSLSEVVGVGTKRYKKNLADGNVAGAFGNFVADGRIVLTAAAGWGLGKTAFKEASRSVKNLNVTQAVKQFVLAPTAKLIPQIKTVPTYSLDIPIQKITAKNEIVNLKPNLSLQTEQPSPVLSTARAVRHSSVGVATLALPPTIEPAKAATQRTATSYFVTNPPTSGDVKTVRPIGNDPIPNAKGPNGGGNNMNEQGGSAGKGELSNNNIGNNQPPEPPGGGGRGSSSSPEPFKGPHRITWTPLTQEARQAVVDKTPLEQLDVNTIPAGNFRRLDLSGLDFSGKNLQGAKFEEANLIKTNLTGANLHRAQIIKANMTKANLTGTDLSHALIKESNLSSVTSDRNIGIFAPNVQIIKSSFKNAVLPGSDLSGALIKESDFGRANLKNSNIQRTYSFNESLDDYGDLESFITTPVNRRNSGIHGSNFKRADLSGGDLSRIQISVTNFREAKLNNANLSGADIELSDFRRAQLQNANLSVRRTGRLDENNGFTSEDEIDSMHFGIRNTNLTGANLKGANLTGNTIATSSMRNANLSGAILSSSGLEDTNMRNANFSKANMTGLHLSNPINGETANYTGATAEKLNIQTLPKSKVLDSRNKETLQEMVRQGVPLYKMWTYRPANLSGIDLANGKLAGANLSKSNLSAANLINADLSGVNLQSANLNKSNLRDAVLSRANLDGASLLEADLGGVDAPNIRAAGADFTGASLAGGNFSDSTLVDAVLVNTNLKGTMLSGSNLTSSNFFGTELSDANTQGANLSGIVRTPPRE